MPEERIPTIVRLQNTCMQEIMTGMNGNGLEEEDWNDRDEWRRKIKL